MDFIKEFLTGQAQFRAARYVAFWAANYARSRNRKLDYVIVPLPEEMPALPEQRNFIQRRLQGEPPISLMELRQLFMRIADDPRPKGAILLIESLDLRLPDLQTLRASIQLIRQKGKQVICLAKSYDMKTYFVASAADQILTLPGGGVDVPGLAIQPQFLKDALEAIGLQFESIAITPYKTAYDTLSQSSMSPEMRAQLDSLLDAQYGILVNGMAERRGMTPDKVREMVDGGSYTGPEALAAGYIDGIANQEDLPRHLKAKHLITLKQADQLLLHKWVGSPRKYVALLPVQGQIMDGESANPPVDIPLPLVGGQRAGDHTVVRQVRQLMHDKRAAAVVLFVDSPGGSALASEAMAAALDELAKSRPVVVYMHNVAASGGYYIATPARWIVAQPGTVTGSIGVLGGRLVNGELFKKLRINREMLVRGANATLLTSSVPLTDEQREMIRRHIVNVYEVFIHRVMASRKMTFEQVDAIGGGRVWLGEQALGHGLVDQLGGLEVALDKARSLAGLSKSAPLIVPHFKKDDYLLPQLAEKASPAAALSYALAGIEQLTSGRVLAILPVWFED